MAANQPTEALIQITDKAREQLLTFKKQQETEDKTDNLCLRIAVMPGGCSGFSYRMGFEKATAEGEDQTIQLDGLTVVVDPRSAMFLAGTRLDYHEGLEGSGFTFDNPNVQHSCGCGKSFGA